jgi:PAS domain S-box-containing protein
MTKHRVSVTASDGEPMIVLLPNSDGRDRVVTRSMLMPIPGNQPPPVDDMICRIEPVSLRLLDLSASLLRFLGESAERLVEQGLVLYLHPDDRQLAEEEFRQTCERGERHDQVLRLKSGAEKWHYMRISAQARYERDGRVNHIRCHLTDITESLRTEHELRRRTEKLIAANAHLRQANDELKRTQAQLVHTEKLAALGTLSAGMAHEINNPLSFAINNLAVLQRDVCQLLATLGRYEETLHAHAGSTSSTAAALARLKEEADLPYLEEALPRIVHATFKGLVRVAQIVEKLRDFAQLDRAEVGMLNINESIDHCLIMLSETLERLHIKVDRQLADVPLFVGKVAEINQAFLDLLLNSAGAIEATGQAAGKIVVTTTCTDDEIVVVIDDNGCGITAEAIPRVFDPFFTTKPVGQGTGLGLSVCHGIISKHGGRIEVTSQIGQGTRLRVSLPRRTVAAMTNGESRSETAPLST